MHTLHDQFPDIQTLTNNLNSILEEFKTTDNQITILAREPNYHESTFPSEIVTCQLTDGSKLRLLCKYAIRRDNDTYGHRGGVLYESKVYRHVLQQLPITTPSFYGVHEDKITGETWLILEFTDKALRFIYTSDPEIMRAAAHWLGKFHKSNESLISTDSLPFLNKYHAEYYLGWAERTSKFVRSFHEQYPWLMKICECFEEIVDTLLKPPNVIIHGEYYPMNIMYSQKTIYPVDWESAAIAIGEIDLISLMEDWPPEFRDVAIAEYQSVRYPEGLPVDFERRCDVAQLYWHFRWLGDRPEWYQDQVATSRIERLESLGELGKQLGLI